MLNDGSGRLTLAPGRLPSGNAETFAAFADLDGDGDVDAFFTDRHGLRVAANDGTGRFGAPVTVAAVTPAGPWTVAIGDFDADGDVDALALGPELEAFANDGSGGLTPATRRALPPGATPQTVAIADVDRDGDLDVLYDGHGLLLHETALRFGALSATALPRVSAASIAVGDVDGDGMVDVLLDGQLWFNDGRGFCTQRSVVGSALAARAGTLVDLTRDGRVDVVITDTGSGLGADHVWINAGGRTFVPAAQYPTGALRGEVRAADFDVDGDLDLVSVEGSVLANAGSAGGSLSVLTRLVHFGTSCATGDVGGDAAPDVLFNDGSLYVSQPGGGFTRSAVNVGAAGGMELADLDRDGDLDAVAGDGGSVVWFTNDGRGGFALAGRIAVPGTAVAVRAADYDGDRNVDVAVAARGGVTPLVLLRNDGRGGFTDATAALEQVRNLVAIDLAWADADADGDLDLLASGSEPVVLANRHVQLESPYAARLGGDWELELTVDDPLGLPRFALVWLDLRPLAAPVALPGIGRLAVDPGSAIATPVELLVPGRTSLRIAGRLPLDPRLVGATLFAQGLVVRVPLALELTGLVADPFVR
jgi:hypothetical protein